MVTSTRNTASAIRAWREISPPHDPLTALSLIDCWLGWPFVPSGCNCWNSVCSTFDTSDWASVSDRICTVAALPTPTLCTSEGWWPSASAKACLASSVVIGPWAPWLGSWICVPPTNSIPRLNPRVPIEARHTITSAAKKTYQRLRLPMMSKAPVPT
jgi:hypothetical protein